MYTTISEVYGTAGITSEQVAEAVVEESIKAAKAVIDKLTETTFYSVDDTGTATDSTDDTLVDDTKTFAENQYHNYYVWINAGTGINQIRKIISNDENTLSLEEDWETNPDETSRYRIFYTATDPRISETIDGNGQNWLFLNHIPLITLQDLTIADTSVSVSNVYKYPQTGKLQLKTTAEQTTFRNDFPQQVVLTYYYGVFPIPYYIKRLCQVYAALFILQSQMGTTHNIPSTYSLPEGSVTVGQAYINIKGTWDTLMREKERLEQEIIKQPVVL